LGISEIEKALNKGFVRCHRSYIIGIQYISSISKTDITFDDGKKLPLSRGNYQTVNQAFIRYFKGGLE
jgi:DNA-binding LytR/AlgR family response regulator